MNVFRQLSFTFLFAIGLQGSVLAMLGFEPQSMAPGQTTQGTWYDSRLRNAAFYSRKTPNTGVIYFYNKGKEFEEFSNLDETGGSIKIDGFDWPTTEQYFQAGKFHDKWIRHLIRTGKDQAGQMLKPAGMSWGMWAIKVAQKNAALKRADWEDVKIGRMLKGLRAKFAPNTALGKTLASTFPRILVEDSYQDAIWGAGNPTCPDARARADQGKGKNLLGRLLMQVRRENYTGRQEAFDPTSSFSLDYLLTGKQI